MAFKMKGFSAFTQKDEKIVPSKVQDPNWKGDGEWTDVKPGTYRGIGNYQSNTKTGKVRTWMDGSDIYDEDTTNKLDSMNTVIKNLPDWTSDDYNPDLKKEKFKEKDNIRKEGTIIGKEPRTFNYQD